MVIEGTEVDELEGRKTGRWLLRVQKKMNLRTGRQEDGY